MLAPKATVDEYRQFEAGNNEVGAAREILPIHEIAVVLFPLHPANDPLGCRMRRPDRGTYRDRVQLLRQRAS
jgi:hypothetical protein